MNRKDRRVRKKTGMWGGGGKGRVQSKEEKGGEEGRKTMKTVEGNKKI